MPEMELVASMGNRSVAWEMISALVISVTFKIYYKFYDKSIQGMQLSEMNLKYNLIIYSGR